MMGIQQQEIWECDLCGKREAVPPDEMAKGFIAIRITSQPEDRKFCESFHKHICDNCVSLILAAKDAYCR